MSRLPVSINLLLCEQSHPVIALDLVNTIVDSDSMDIRDKCMQYFLQHIREQRQYILVLISLYDEQTTKKLLGHHIWECFHQHIYNTSARELQCLGKTRDEMIFLSSNFSHVFCEWHLPLDIALNDSLIHVFSAEDYHQTTTKHHQRKQTEENLLLLSPLSSPLESRTNSSSSNQHSSSSSSSQHPSILPNYAPTFLNTAHYQQEHIVISHRDTSPSSAGASPNSQPQSTFDCGSMLSSSPFHSQLGDSLSHSSTSSSSSSLKSNSTLVPSIKSRIHRIRSQWNMLRQRTLTHQKETLNQLCHQLATLSTVDSSSRSSGTALLRTRRSSGQDQSVHLGGVEQNRFSVLSSSSSTPDLSVLAQSLTYRPPQLSPLLPPTNKKVTLCLDLDGTLVHTVTSNDGIWLNIRPYCRYFFSELYKLKDLFEVVIFSGSSKSVTETVVSQLDNGGVVDHVLHRSHCALVDKHYWVKELSGLGRDCAIIVDDNRFCFLLNNCDGIPVLCWKREDKNDTELLSVLKVIQAIYMESIVLQDQEEAAFGPPQQASAAYVEISRKHIEQYVNRSEV
mmetsp:Transcript_10645/g.39737  ORF Transcript_10645/g.39737 Transcript_10645/m.39737 type:complete len:564 (-) Transcript_10645:79-1770(-)|eukprot:CAMPEP_0117444428 /NCGR_PEP_ID=MMETSP0759-20121206/5236_1 /TAXON_ID=63605 /ORGANISM="Percolomonas cosmopolitus, Strain WS" /LENGTH=563 /DNA_ID=CAMNT_0005236495 /DNA_START=263 /DNA_END=1954 /DNA_ORIENTATION=-